MSASHYPLVDGSELLVIPHNESASYFIQQTQQNNWLIDSIKKIEPKKETQNTEQLFEISDEPPEEFKLLNLNEENLLSVYYDNQKIAEVMASFNNESIKFNNVETLVDHIPAAKDKKALTEALSHQIKVGLWAHCEKEPSDSACKIQNKPAFVLLDRSQYKAVILLNKRFIKSSKAKTLNYLGPSSTNSSMISSLNLNTSHSKDSQYANLYFDPIVAYKNNYLKAEGYVERESSDGEITQQTHFDEINLNRVTDSMHYTAGAFQTEGGLFTGNESILGVGIKDDPKTAKNFEELLGTPLEVYLTMPGTVKIYKGPRLLNETYLNAGRHVIDTESFPGGVYDVTIEITSDTGQVTTETQLFSKSSEVLPIGVSSYQFAFGFLAKPDNTVTTPGLFEQYVKTPYLELKQGRAFSATLGITNQLSATDQHALISSSLFLKRKSMDYAIGVLASTDKEYGFSLDGLYSLDTFNLRFGARKILNSKNNESSETVVYDPITQSTSNLYANASYSANRWQFNVSAVQNDSSSKLTQFSGKISYQLWRKTTSDAKLTLNMTDSNKEKLVFLGFDWRWRPKNSNIQHSASLGYQRLQPNTNNQTGSNAAFGSQWKKTWDRQHKLEFSGNVNKQPDNLSYRGNTRFETNQILGSISAQHITQNSQQAAQTNYTSSFSSAIIATPDKWEMAYSKSYKSAIIIHVTGPKGVLFDVSANKTPLGVITSHSDKTFFLNANEAYKLTITPKDNSDYVLSKIPTPITVYRGNVYTLNLSAEKATTLIAKIVDQQGNPIPFATVENASEPSFTGEAGYTTVIVTSSTHTLKLIKDEKQCTVTLPKINPEKEFLFKDELVCRESK
ncbi:MAG: hypothetical protein COV52_07530 [Gammaproteobacteria bacterium CG11_big_fil_rev_8_21_14_0_20_46_22]|nr:MAG: hypothetical protein COW05_06770 [Gammaproteobacteria bacterium CG12_big_fil_rev_8_21_14_0_65_46_12]PIR10733.1 MAG: hypothetical protein COV52_07530 [Gammaproteobacteria bacterium CG11_big_fil_rev_8_21_14_0_20_46_22]